MNFSVKRLSSPLCISRSHDVGVAFIPPSANEHMLELRETHDALSSPRAALTENPVDTTCWWGVDEQWTGKSVK